MSAPLRVAMTLEQCWHRLPGGTATSMLALASALDARDDLDVVGVAARHRAPPRVPYRPPVPVRHLPLPRRALYGAWQQARRPRVELATGPVDVVHATTMAIPPPSVPLVVTVHDLAFLAEPAHFTRRGRRFFTRGLDIVRRDAALVIVPSRAVEEECVHAGLVPGRLRVVPHGVDRPLVPAEQVAATRERYGLRGRYVLWTGTREPRKNLTGLLAAFRQVDADVDLVLVGPRGWGPDLTALMTATPRVRVLGFLPDDERDALYAGAEVFAFPSLREGFGLPVLESMAQGTPVVTTAGSAMAEFAVGALVDATDPSALADALSTLLADDASRLALGEQARQRAADLTWTAAATATAAIYREALIGPR